MIRCEIDFCEAHLFTLFFFVRLYRSFADYYPNVYSSEQKRRLRLEAKNTAFVYFLRDNR